MSHHIQITRFSYRDTCTLGAAKIFDQEDNLVFEFVTLELPWLNNQSNISCIPCGQYEAILHHSNHLKRDVLWLQHTYPRSMIYIHNGNYTSQIQGCILCGVDHIDINNDGIMDVTSSTSTLNKILSIVGDKCTISIIN